MTTTPADYSVLVDPIKLTYRALCDSDTSVSVQRQLCDFDVQRRLWVVSNPRLQADTSH